MTLRARTNALRFIVGPDSHLRLVEAAGGFWLALAFTVYRGAEISSGVATAGMFAGLCWLIGAQASRMAPPRPPAAILTLLFAVVALTAAARVTGWITGLIGTGTQALWLGTAAALAGALTRLAFRQLQIGTGRSAWAESLRWVAVLAVAVWVSSPYLTRFALGAGDAYWYTLMTADFTEQVRAGQFPVWAGVTEYAFNGAVSPLRLAPWLQHFAALLDFGTGQTLGPTALVNLVLVVSALGIGATSYFGLRLILRERPTAAGLITLALLLSPGTLAPVYVGDQYMTYVALPFLPLVCAGLWLVSRESGLRPHALLTIGAAGLWLSHPPIALWTSLIIAPLYLITLLRDRTRERFTWAGVALVAFLVLGSFAIHSAVRLDNTNAGTTLGGSVVEEIRAAFPHNFTRLSKEINTTWDYQAGLTLLVLFVAALVWLPRRRTIDAVLPSLAAVAVCFLIIPIPGVTDEFWEWVPSLVLKASNRWTNQRMFPILVFFIAFAFAAVHRTTTGARSRGFWTACLALGLPLLAWSAYEANRMVVRARAGIDRGVGAARLIERDNLLLTRYAFVSFEYAPSYFSHGYLDPVLEHRILRADRSELARNSEAAVGRGALPARNRTLLSDGVFKGTNSSDRPFYDLNPQIVLPPQVRLALWVDVMKPGERGWLQFKAPHLFREYTLPESGHGMESDLRPPPRGFGTLPSSSKVVSLINTESTDVRPQSIAILPDRPVTTEIDYARYELWQYDPESLPVVVKSWIPYRLIVDSSEPGYVETPRMWLPGYRARVNGQTVPVERSPDNLAMFKVPAGWTDVTIRYIPPVSLELHLWITVLGWGAVVAFLFRQLMRFPGR